MMTRIFIHRKIYFLIILLFVEIYICILSQNFPNRYLEGRSLETNDEKIREREELESRPSSSFEQLVLGTASLFFFFPEEGDHSINCLNIYDIFNLVSNFLSFQCDCNHFNMSLLLMARMSETRIR